MEIARCNENDYEVLAMIWERSVRATHDFLTEKVIDEIKAALIPDYFPNEETKYLDSGKHLHCLRCRGLRQCQGL